MLKVALRRNPVGAVLAVCTYKAAGEGMLLTTKHLLLHVLAGQSYPL